MFARYWVYARPDRWVVFIALCAVPIVSVLGLIPPVLLMHGIDVNLMGHRAAPLMASILEGVGLGAVLEPGMGGLEATAWLFLGVVLTEYIARSVYVFGLQFAGQRSVGRLRSAIYKHITNQSAAFFDRRPTGELLTRATSDVEALGDSLSTGVVTILSDVLNVAAIATLMALLSWKLTVVTFAVTPLLVVVVNFFRKRLRANYLAVRQSLAELNAFLQEHLVGIEVVQLFGRERSTYVRFKERGFRYLRSTQRSNVYDAGLYAVMEGISVLSIALLLWYGGKDVVDGILSLGLLVAFIEYVQRIYIPIKEFSGKFAVLQQAVAAMERIVSLLDCNQTISPGRLALTDARGAIAFHSVRFAYPGRDVDVLKGISFRIEPGQAIAVVGATGSGKSTLGRLLTRMYDGYRGSILLDGHELRDLTPESVRARISVVQQDVVLFKGTIAFNITLGNPRISEEKMKESARLVQADTFIRDLPGGYDFVVSERGANLSAGQAQLIAFARVIAFDSPVVVMDEATASVDTRTEQLLQRAVALILERKTVLVIAHRLSTVQAADGILVMRAGEIVERGTHSALLARGGYYAALYRRGFSEEIVEEDLSAGSRRGVSGGFER